MAARKLTDDDHARIVEMRESGLGYAMIAKALTTPARSVSPEIISYHCLRLGAEPPKPAKSWDQIKGPSVMRRGDHLVRRFTPEDDTQLLALEAQGLNPGQIGRAMSPPRAINSVRGRLMCLARRDARSEAAS